MGFQDEEVVDVVVVGAGLGGICLGVKLKAAGFDNFVILDKADDVGGTWRDNTYPGLTVDIPAITYSYSFAQNPGWSSWWAPQPELLAYCQRVTDENGLRSHLRFNANVSDSAYDPDENLWRTRTDDGTVYTSRYLVSATGFLNTPSWPDIEGMDSFKGRVIHSSNWDHDYDFSGKRVGFIGTGATGIQLVPEVAKCDVEQMHVFQRTAIWLLPKPSMTVPKPIARAFRWVPGLMRLMRLLTAAFMDLVFFRVFIKYRQVQWFGKIAARICRWHVRKQIDDPELAEKFIPDYDWGCKRPSFSQNFYPTFNRDNVELVTDSINKVTPDGIVTSDGTERSLDVMICATGFKPYSKESTPTHPVYGKDGEELSDFWDVRRYQTVRGVAVHNYPNYFMIAAPYSIASTSYIAMIETSTRYIVRLLKAARKQKADYIEADPEVQEQEHEHVLKKRKTEIFFVGNCETSNSYYYDRFGDTPNFRPTNHPLVWFNSRFGRLGKYFEIGNSSGAGADRGGAAGKHATRRRAK